MCLPIQSPSIFPYPQVAGAGGGCSAAACSEVLCPAIAAVLQDTTDLADSTSAAAAGQKALRPLQANCGVLCVLHASLKAVATAAAAAVADQGATASVGADWATVAALMPELLVALNRLQALVSLFQQQQQQQKGAGQDTGSNGVSGLHISKHADILQREQLQLWLLLLWQDVLVLPPSISQLQPQQLTAAAQQLLQLAIHGSSAEVELELAPGSSASEQAAAAAALTQLAAWTPAGPPAAGAGADEPLDSMLALSSCADPLLQLLQRPVFVATTAAAAAGSEEGEGVRASAVRLLGQLGGSGPAAAWQVLQWLLPLVLQHVRQCAWVSAAVAALGRYCQHQVYGAAASISCTAAGESLCHPLHLVLTAFRCLSNRYSFASDKIGAHFVSVCQIICRKSSRQSCTS